MTQVKEGVTILDKMIMINTIPHDSISKKGMATTTNISLANTGPQHLEIQIPNTTSQVYLEKQLLNNSFLNILYTQLQGTAGDYSRIIYHHSTFKMQEQMMLFLLTYPLLMAIQIPKIE